MWSPSPSNELSSNPGDYIYLEAVQPEERGVHHDLADKQPTGGLIFRHQPASSQAASAGAASHASTSSNQAADQGVASTGSNSNSHSRSQRQISVSQAVAQSFGWSSRNKVLAWKVSPLPKEHQATYVELSFKDIYLGRADMLRLNLSLRDQPVYIGQRLAIPGSSSAKCIVQQIWAHGRPCRSAVVTFDSDIAYRSHSARVVLCLQISSEMHHFGVDGSLYYEKLLDQFLPTLFHKWQGCNHALTIVLFARVLYDEEELSRMHPEQLAGLGRDQQGRPCLDVYKTAVDTQAGCEWRKMQSSLVEEVRHFERRVLLHHSARSDGGLAGRISEAHDGNVLEVINLAGRGFDNTYIDRDLTRTGHTVILVTAGTCRFTVDKNLLRLTSENLVNAGVCVDAVSLCKIPLHDVPVFAFRSVDPAAAASAKLPSAATACDSNKDPHGRKADDAQPASLLSIESMSAAAQKAPDAASRSFANFPPGLQSVMRPSRRSRTQRLTPPPVYDPLYFDVDGSHTDSSLVKHPKLKSKWFHCLPDWMDASFYSRQPDKPFRADRYMPRIVMQEVENLGVESDSAVISLPLLPRSKAGSGRDDAKERQLERDRLDDLSCGAEHRPSSYKKKTKGKDKALETPKREPSCLEEDPPTTTQRLQAPPLQRQSTSGTATPRAPKGQRGRTISRAAPSSSSVQTTKAGHTLALTPLRTRDRSVSVSSKASKRTPSYGLLSPSASTSTASGTFTPALVSTVSASAKATPTGAAAATTTTKGPSASSWLSGLLGGKSALSKPQLSGATENNSGSRGHSGAAAKPKQPTESVHSQAAQALRSASPARSEPRSTASAVGPIAMKKTGSASESGPGALSLALGTSMPSSADSHLSMLPRSFMHTAPSSSQEAAPVMVDFKVNPCNPLKNRGWPMHQVGRWGRAFDQRHIRWKYA